MVSKEELPEPLLYSMEEAAFMLSISVSALHRETKKGNLKIIRPTPGCVRITRTELERFIKEAPGTSCQTPRDCPPCGGQV